MVLPTVSRGVVGYSVLLRWWTSRTRKVVPVMRRGKRYSRTNTLRTEATCERYLGAVLIATKRDQVLAEEAATLELELLGEGGWDIRTESQPERYHKDED